MTAALVVFWLGALADWYTTKRVLDRGGKEINGIVRRIIDRLPWDTEAELMGIKLAVFAIFLWMDAPPAIWYVFGGVQLVAGIGNYFNVWARWLR